MVRCDWITRADGTEHQRLLLCEYLSFDSSSLQSTPSLVSVLLDGLKSGITGDDAVQLLLCWQIQLMSTSHYLVDMTYFEWMGSKESLISQRVILLDISAIRMCNKLRVFRHGLIYLSDFEANISLGIRADNQSCGPRL